MSGCCEGGAGAVQTERDPVCGRSVNRVTALRHEHLHEDYFFCSESCRSIFIIEPESVLRGDKRRQADTGPVAAVRAWLGRAFKTGGVQ